MIRMLIRLWLDLLLGPADPMPEVRTQPRRPA